MKRSAHTQAGAPKVERFHLQRAPARRRRAGQISLILSTRSEPASNHGWQMSQAARMANPSPARIVPP